MRNNNQTNNLIKWGIIIFDFVILNVLISLFVFYLPQFANWTEEKIHAFYLVCNMTLLLSQYRFSTIIHLRRIGADGILKRTFLLSSTQTLLAYILLRVIHFDSRVGWHLLALGILFFLTLIVVRLIERWIVKKFRMMGRNTRTFTLVGSNKEILKITNKLLYNPTYGYKICGYYGSLDEIPHDGSVEDFLAKLNTPEELKLGEELYLCVPRKERDIIKNTIRLCDKHVIKFYYVPLSEENMHLEPVMLDDEELYTAYSSLLEDPLNKAVKRVFDIIMSSVFLVMTAPLFPFICFKIKRQSPGPLFFKQRRTGIDGREFECYKFRSMHVNSDADILQATKDDPRKFAFGDFMRKTNLDELPQFWNVLKGDMSIVGPRPHMLSHTEQYSQLIDKYMVRHFVKPGVTGWAQVTGFRGETKELWQMEGRVERDIWYIQHWSVWLDLRIIWMTVKTIFHHDSHAY